MSIAENRIDLIVETAATAATDAEGHFEQKTLIDKIRAQLKSEKLTPDLKEQIEQDQAAYYGRRFVNRRKPKLSKDGGLFHPAYVLPLGDGKRVWMDKATVADLLMWVALETANTAAVLTTAGRRSKYVAQRVDAFRDHPKWKLGEIERKSFDYAETDEPPDETEDD